MGFDATKGDISDNFSPFPAGTYKVVLIKAEKKDGAKEGAKYLNCQFKVVEGKHAKRIVFHLFNFKNNNTQTVEIAEKHLRQMMLSIGVTNIESVWDLTSLMNKPAEARIAIEKSEEHGDKNKINGFIVPEGSAKPSNSKDIPSTGKGKKGKKGKKDPWDKKIDKDKKKAKKDKKKKKKDKKK